MKSNGKTEETVTIPKAEYESLKQQVAWLMEQLKLSKRRQFGVSSEKSEYVQESLFQESLFDEAEAAADLSAAEPELEEVKAYRRKKSRGTDRLPPDLPVEVIEYELPEEERVCPDCGGLLHVMGRETREELKLIPAKAVITRRVRHVYACRNCEKNGEQVPFAKASVPEPVIKGSFASPESVAHIATQKFVMGVPLYRQEQEWERNGVHLSRQTMSNWLIRSSVDWLKPIYDRLHELLCAGEVLHADETTVQVLHEPGRAAQTKSYMWLYRTSGDAKHPIVLYDYRTSRSGNNPAEFLHDFKGYLHTDGWDEYHRRLPDGIVVVGCWAHCRRKFDEALKSLPKKDHSGSESLRGLQFCDHLFSLERKYAGLPPDDNFAVRRLARIEHSKPVMDAFFAWAAERAAKDTLPNSLLGQAVNYALGQRRWLERVLLDGRLELSNNRAERSIKPFVIGRKNWLFNNTPKGADASAMIYSIIETVKENGIIPFDYLSAVFSKAPNTQMDASLDPLLPWNLCGHT
jgi:transposase